MGFQSQDSNTIPTGALHSEKKYREWLFKLQTREKYPKDVSKPQPQPGEAQISESHEAYTNEDLYLRFVVEPSIFCSTSQFSNPPCADTASAQVTYPCLRRQCNDRRSANCPPYFFITMMLNLFLSTTAIVGGELSQQI